MRSGTAPVPCSGRRNPRVRVSHRGDRQLTHLLYLLSIALVQIRLATHPERLYYQRKLQEGTTRGAAIPTREPRLGTVVSYRLLAHTAARAPPDGASARPIAA